MECNSLFNRIVAIRVPYPADCFRIKAYHSYLYFGLLLISLNIFAEKKVNSLVCRNSLRTNAFLVRNYFMNKLKQTSVNESNLKCLFRQSRDKEYNLNYLNFNSSIKLIINLPILYIKIIRFNQIIS